MSTFENRLADHISTELKVDVQDVLDAMNSFGTNEKKQTAPAKKKVPKYNETVKTSTKKTEPPKIVSQKSAEPNTCERIKKGQTEECGKNAKRQLKVNGVTMWLCGADKSGCYAAAVKANVAKDIDIEVNEAKITKRNKNPVPKGTAAKADTAKSLIHKITPEDMKTATVKTSKGKLIYETTKRYLWDPVNNEFYGVLGDDNETITDLKSDDIKWIEAHNHIVRSTKKREGLKNREDKKDKEAAEEKAKEAVKKAVPVKGKVETKKVDVEKTKKSTKKVESSEESSSSSASSSDEKDDETSSEKDESKDSADEKSSSEEEDEGESGSDEPSESSEESGTTDD